MTRAAILALVLCCIAAIVWFVSTSTPVERGPDGAADRADAAMRRAEASPELAVPSRQDVAATAQPVASTDAASDDALTGLVLDAADRPIADADCRVLAVESDGFAWLDRGEVAQEREIARVTTDSLGRFAVPLPDGVPHRLRVAATDFGTARSGPHVAGEQVVVRLAAAVLLGPQAGESSRPATIRRPEGPSKESGRGLSGRRVSDDARPSVAASAAMGSSGSRCGCSSTAAQ